MIHGGIRVLHERAIVVGVERIDADADGARRVERVPRDFARPRQRLDDLGCDLRCILGLLQSLQGHHELIAAESRHRVALADTSLHALGHFSEQQVADLVAERVVDVLEAI